MKDAKNIGLKIGQYNTLKVKRFVDFGAFLSPVKSDDKESEILMPQKYLEDLNLQVGDLVDDCLVYTDSDDRLIATREKPLVLANQFASLECTAVTQFGAFLNWGPIKDLLVPYKQQRSRMQIGDHYIVFAYADEQSGRMVATEYFEKFLNNLAPNYKQGEEVDALVFRQTPMGYLCIINNLHTGMVYNSQLHGKRLQIGQRLPLYIEKVREDDKIDLIPTPIGHDKATALHEQILQQLHINGGSIALGDKSRPEDIELLFRCSKKAFKMAIGGLYKQGKIKIEDFRITEL